MTTMASSSDSDLLRQYTAGGPGAQAAFGALVARHVDLVYTSAARQLRDRHAAEDVTQTVFIVLARKAPSLSARPQSPLSPWLLSVTRYAARDWQKAEGRRRRHERAAMQDRADEMARTARTESTAAREAAAREAAGRESPGAAAPHASANPASAGQASAGPAGVALAVEGLDEVLDDALARLSESARAAVVLRFFEDKTFKEVGERLGIAEAAAKQRVFRALERLRVVLARRGVRSPSADALGVTLAATAVQPAPAGVAGAVSAGVSGALSGAATSAAALSGAGGGAAAAAGGGGAAQGVIIAMAWAKLKVALIAVAVVALAASTTAFVGYELGVFGPGGRGAGAARTMAAGPDAPYPMPTSPGTYPPSFDPLNGTVSPYTGGGPIVVVARTADGAPVAAADVLVAPRGRQTALYAQSRQAFVGKTGPDGRFTFTPRTEPSGIIVRSPQLVGVAQANGAGELAVTVQPWGRIEGVVRRGKTPVAGADLLLQQPRGRGFPQWVDPNLYIRSDEQGKFVVERVLPGQAVIDLRRGGNREQAYRSVVPPGQTVAVAMGVAGRLVVARAVPPPPAAAVGAGGARGVLRPVGAEDANRAGDWPAHLPRPAVPTYPATVAPDGTVRADGVPAGDFQLSVTYAEATGEQATMEEVAVGTLPVSVPATPAGDTDEPLDAGTMEMRTRRQLKVGEMAPPLAGVGLDGAPVRMDNFRGKYVLLHAWGAANAGLVRQAEWLWVLYGRFGGEGEGRVQLLGVNTDATEGMQFRSAADAAVAKALPWPQVVSPGKAGPLPPEILGSTIVLIGPDGRVVARTDQLHKSPDIVRVALTAAGASRPLWAAPGAKVTVEAVPREQAKNNPPYRLVPAPAPNDLAQGATFSIVDGRLLHAHQLNRINDGRGPTNEDAPSEVIYFNWGIQPEGRIGVDLGRVAPVRQIVTHSWHKDVRGPQVYNLFASDGTAPNFNPAPKAGTDPVACGWTRVAAVDTWPAKGLPGGRYGVSVASDSPGKPMGNWRYLLLATYQTEHYDVEGYTFYSEIDVFEQK